MNRRSLFKMAGWGMAAISAPAVTAAAALIPMRREIDGEEISSPLVIRGNGVTITNCSFRFHPGKYTNFIDVGSPDNGS